MQSQNSFATLMARLQARDNEAAAIVFHRFADQLIALVRARLTECVRGKVDAEDIVQSVFRSFFTRHGGGQFELQNWDSLWGLLTTMALRKCGHRICYHRAACRDVRRECSLSGAEDWDQLRSLLAREPSPTEAAALNDVLEHLMHSLEAPDREILVLHLQGYTQEEISTQLGRAERTVRRAIERIRKRLFKLYNALV